MTEPLQITKVGNGPRFTLSDGRVLDLRGLEAIAGGVLSFNEGGEPDGITFPVGAILLSPDLAES